MSSLRTLGARAVVIFLTSAVAACSTSYVAPQKVLISASEPTQCQNLGEVRGLSGFGKSWSRENALHKAVAIGANTIFYPEDQPRNIDLSPGTPENLSTPQGMNAYWTIALAYLCDASPS